MNHKREAPPCHRRRLIITETINSTLLLVAQSCEWLRKRYECATITHWKLFSFQVARDVEANKKLDSTMSQVLIVRASFLMQTAVRALEFAPNKSVSLESSKVIYHVGWIRKWVPRRMQEKRRKETASKGKANYAIDSLQIQLAPQWFHQSVSSRASSTPNETFPCQTSFSL